MAKRELTIADLEYMEQLLERWHLVLIADPDNPRAFYMRLKHRVNEEPRHKIIRTLKNIIKQIEKGECWFEG